MKPAISSTAAGLYGRPCQDGAGFRQQEMPLGSNFRRSGNKVRLVSHTMHPAITMRRPLLVLLAYVLATVPGGLCLSALGADLKPREVAALGGTASTRNRVSSPSGHPRKWPLELAWVRQEGGTNDEGGWHVEVDNESCVYVLGSFERSVDSGTNGSASGVYYHFLARYNTRGDLLWRRVIPGSGLLAPSEFHLDAAGHGYVLGTFSGQVDFGGHIVSSPRAAVFIAKYNRAGDALWAGQADVLDVEDAGFSSAVDRQGNVYLAGGFSREIQIGGELLTARGGNLDVFVVKFGSRGEVLWASQSDTGESDWPSALAVDARGNVYVAGTVQTDEGPSTGGAFQFIRRSFLTSQDARGGLIWTLRSSPCLDTWHGQAIALDPAGNVFLAGHFRGSLVLGNHALARGEGEASWIAKVHPSGQVLWLRGAGQTDSDSVVELATDGTGNLYAAGNFLGTATFADSVLTSGPSGQAFVVKYGREGYPLWARQIRSQSFTQALYLRTDNFGRVYLLGEGGGTIVPDGKPIPSGDSGYPHLFLASFLADGDLGWKQDLDGNTLRMWSVFDVDRLGNCFVTGSFADSLTFGDLTLTSLGSRDFFLAKYASSFVAPRR